MNASICVEGAFERFHDFMGFEEALIAIMEEPEEVYDFIGSLTDFRIKYFKKLHDYYDISQSQNFAILRKILFLSF